MKTLLHAFDKDLPYIINVIAQSTKSNVTYRNSSVARFRKAPLSINRNGLPDKSLKSKQVDINHQIKSFGKQDLVKMYICIIMV